MHSGVQVVCKLATTRHYSATSITLGYWISEIIQITEVLSRFKIIKRLLYITTTTNTIH